MVPSLLSAANQLVENSGTTQTEVSFQSFADLCESIERSPRKSDKSTLIYRYLADLSPSDLITAARCLTGYILPPRELLIFSVNPLIVVNSIAACTGVPSSFVKERLTDLNDLGDVTFELFGGGASPANSQSLTLASAVKILSEIPAISGTRRKSALITRLLRRMTPIEAKYLVRLISGDLNIGVHERELEDALSRWQEISFTKVQAANMLIGDIGETALICSIGKIDDAGMQLYKPVPFMHAQPVTMKQDLSRILPEQFVIEDKFDGVRTQVHIGLDIKGLEAQAGAVHDGLRIVIFSDTLDECTNDFVDLVPGLAALMTAQAGTVDAIGVILDGAIVPMLNGDIIPLSEMEERLTNEPIEPGLMEGIRFGFVAFDQLFGDGRSLIQDDWYTRASNLDKIRFDMVSTFRVRSTISSSMRDIENAFERAISRGSQGVIVKNPRSSYRPGRRQRDWCKISKNS